MSNNDRELKCSFCGGRLVHEQDEIDVFDSDGSPLLFFLTCDECCLDESASDAIGHLNAR